VHFFKALMKLQVVFMFFFAFVPLLPCAGVHARNVSSSASMTATETLGPYVVQTVASQGNKWLQFL